MGSRSIALPALCLVVAVSLVVTAVAATGIYPFTDNELSGPVQPIEYSHLTHAGTLGINCLYCHSAADKSQHATVPALSVCMGCHQWVKTSATPGGAEEIEKLVAYYERGESIPWIRIHNLPEHVQFKHFRHVAVGIACQDCHGQIQQMNRVWLVPQTVLRPSSAYLPAAKLQMGWCMDCHLKNQNAQVFASDDCAACHY